MAEATETPGREQFCNVVNVKLQMGHEAKTAISHARRTTHAPQGWKPCSEPRGGGGAGYNHSGAEAMRGLPGRETSLQPEYFVSVDESIRFHSLLYKQKLGGNNDPHLLGHYDPEELEDLPTIIVSHLSELPEISTFPDPYEFKAMLAGLVQ
ncbi:hypothetical protein DFH06DRAFT_1129906 [Mycena polygramma]|nr:hypothetical protein DFH06DRAFT_1129906 [Mycena polygramma]